jgi:peroxiredoxin Q/BCP
MADLKKGGQAPAFALTDQDGRRVSLSDFRGAKLLVYFYPKADTPGCTTQACSVRDAVPDLRSLGVAAVGISPDLPEAQKKFALRYGLNFPLLSDPDHRVAEAYGTWGDKTSYGRTVKGIIRSSFLIDADGRVVEAWYKVKPEQTVPFAREALSSEP